MRHELRTPRYVQGIFTREGGSFERGTMEETVIYSGKSKHRKQEPSLAKFCLREGRRKGGDARPCNNVKEGEGGSGLPGLGSGGIMADGKFPRDGRPRSAESNTRKECRRWVLG